MRKTLFMCLALLGAGVVLPISVFAGSWSTVQEYQPFAGQISWMNDIDCAPNGDCYATGGADDMVSGQGYGVVLKSSDQGKFWAEVDRYAEPKLMQNPRALTFDSVGNPITIGEECEPFSCKLMIKKSEDVGQTWKRISSYERLRGFTLIQAFKRNPVTGDLYAAGWESNPKMSAEGNFLFVIKSSDDGVSWTRIDETNIEPNKGLYVQGIAFSKEGYVLTSSQHYGAKTGPNQKNRAFIRRSKDHGASWETVDEQAGGFSLRISSDSQGKIWYAGAILEGTGRPGLIRVSEDSGSNWRTAATLSGELAWEVKEVSSTELLAVSGKRVDGKAVMVVRSSLDGGKTWLIDDSFSSGDPGEHYYGFCGMSDGSVALFGNFGSYSPGGSWKTMKAVFRRRF